MLNHRVVLFPCPKTSNETIYLVIHHLSENKQINSTMVCWSNNFHGVVTKPYLIFYYQLSIMSRLLCRFFPRLFFYINNFEDHDMFVFVSATQGYWAKQINILKKQTSRIDIYNYDNYNPYENALDTDALKA